MRRTLVASEVCAALLVLPAIASASSVTLQAARADPNYSGDAVVYHASPGEQNAVTAHVALEPEGQVWTIIDPGAVIVAQEPCRAADAHTVTCAARADRYTESARFELGDRDDRFRSSSMPVDGDAKGDVDVFGGPGDDDLAGETASNALYGDDGDDSLTATTQGNGFSLLKGGAGDDRLNGGPLSDALDGGGGQDGLFGGGGDDRLTDGDRGGATGDAGPGPDLVDGGDGDDLVAYARRTAPLQVDLAGRRADGERGEGDRLTGVESVEGGSGDDVLLGDEHANDLSGRGGRDRLAGRGAADRLAPGTGGSLPLSCGTGRDFVVHPRSRDRLAADCESVEASRLALSYLPAHPLQSPSGRLSYQATCPDIERCSGAVQLREASGSGRLLAAGAFPVTRWDEYGVGGDGFFELRLTPLGAGLSARRRGVLAIMRFAAVVPTPSEAGSAAVRWTIRFNLRR